MLVRTKPAHIILMMASLLIPAATAFQYQKDTDDHCAEQVGDCTFCDALWFKCPITCADHLKKEGSFKEVKNDPEQFFQMQVTKQNGDILELDDFEGYVTLYAIIPLMQGMAQFYYEMLEHVQLIFPYTVEVLVAPYNVGRSEVKIKPHEKPKITLLKEENEPTPVMAYLNLAKTTTGNFENRLYFDRVTIFLVASDGMFVERVVSPTMPLLEQRVSSFLKQLEWHIKPEL